MRKLDGPFAASSKCLRIVVGLALACAAAAASAAGLLTIVDGEATVVDGARTLIAGEGLKLPDDVILRTGVRTTLVRVEWADGTVADFGPDTHAMINPAGLAARGGRGPSVYLLRGWVKQASLGTVATGGLWSPRLEVPSFKGALVMMVAADEVWAFAESGALQVVERDTKPPTTHSLRTGETYARTGSAVGSVAQRPTPAQMQRVPRGFRDTLPLRAATLKSRDVEPRLGTPAPYEELREWLNVAEPAMRRGFPKRFAARAREPAFRAGLAGDLGAHPEWERLLFPERFIIKPASPPR
jgi:hypothetical protein